MALKTGDLLILERYFTPPFFVASRIVRVPKQQIKGQTLNGFEIARWDANYLADNFEALAIVNWHGKTLVQVMSDDNFSIFQNTYLLTFQLK